MKRVAIAVYAVVAYVAFLASAVWAIAFLWGVGPLKTVDTGAPGSPAVAIAVDLALLLLFAAQHSMMARGGFKARLTRVLPPVAERSTYVLLASGLLILLFWQWRPLPATVWNTAWQPAAALIAAVYVAGWLIVVGSTFMIDHLTFFGLRHVESAFKESWLYAWVRHPMMLGLLITFWATPRMSVGHLLFATASTGYIVAGTRLEERDLGRALGERYLDYAARVPAFIPLPRRSGQKLSTS